MAESGKTGWGVASLVLGIISVILALFFPYIGIILAIVAVVFSIMQRKHKKTGVATAGLVLGIIGIILNVIMLLFVAAFLALFAKAGY